MSEDNVGRDSENPYNRSQSSEKTDESDRLFRMGEAGPKDLEQSTDSHEPEPKRQLLANPSFLTYLYEYEARRVLIEFFANCVEDGVTDEFSKARLNRETGVSRRTLGRHLPVLIVYGIVEEGGSDARPRYRIPTDTDSPLHNLINFNKYLASVVDTNSLDTQ